MSRELKFRAWHTKLNTMLKNGDHWFPGEDRRGKWHQGTCYPITVTSAGILSVKRIVSDPCGWVDVHNAKGQLTSYYANWEELRLTSGDLILEQFTGLHDRNEREIYEGDILRCWGDGCIDEGDAEVYPVEYCGERDYPAFDLANHVNVDCNALSYYMACGHLEVIGNVHENPELLQ